MSHTSSCCPCKHTPVLDSVCITLPRTNNASQLQSVQNRFCSFPLSPADELVCAHVHPHRYRHSPLLHSTLLCKPTYSFVRVAEGWGGFGGGGVQCTCLRVHHAHSPNTHRMFYFLEQLEREGKGVGGWGCSYSHCRREEGEGG